MDTYIYSKCEEGVDIHKAYPLVPSVRLDKPHLGQNMHYKLNSSFSICIKCSAVSLLN